MRTLSVWEQESLLDFDIAKSLDKALLERYPKKQRKTKDQRLSAESGFLPCPLPFSMIKKNKKNSKKGKAAPT